MKISPCFNVGGFWYEPRGDWFSFGKVRKLCFLCSCKQTRETSISQMRARHIRPPSSAGTACMYQDSQQKWEKRVYYVWNMDILLTKAHGFATGGLYSPPGAVWGMFYYGCALVLGDMVIFISSYRQPVRSPIHDIIVHGWVGARERLSVLVINYFITIWWF